MRVFVAGATGVVGRRAVQRLVAAGHSVTGVARSPERAELLESLGATPAAVDLSDRTPLRRAVEGHEVVLNLTTHVPSFRQAARLSSFMENDRIRTEASRNLVDAALVTGAARYVQESVAFLYADGGGEWLDEDSEVAPFPATASAPLAEEQAMRFTQGGGTGVVLRFGAFYSADSGQFQESVAMIRKRWSPVPGRPESYLSPITATDAGSAAVAALTAPAGIWNVVDDWPPTRQQYVDALAAAVGVDNVRWPPQRLLRTVGANLRGLMRSQRVSNRRFKAATGWAPRTTTARTGLAPVVAELDGTTRR